jgi:hypothetical protein
MKVTLNSQVQAFHHKVLEEVVGPLAREFPMQWQAYKRAAEMRTTSRNPAEEMSLSL